MNCRFCGKSLSRDFNLRRHESEYCPLQDHNSSIESGSGQSIENIQTLMIPPQKVIRIIQIIQMKTKRMNMGFFENGNNDKKYARISRADEDFYCRWS